MRTRISAVVVITALALCACSESPKEAAINGAREYARNAVGKTTAPVWDEMVCTYGDKAKSPQFVTGFVNGGKGAQLFIVTIDATGKPDGEVELKPFTPEDASEVGYWMEVESSRKAKSDKPCGRWKELMSSSASSYWHAIQDGMGSGEAMLKMFDDVENVRRSHRASEKLGK